MPTRDLWEYTIAWVVPFSREHRPTSPTNSRAARGRRQCSALPSSVRRQEEKGFCDDDGCLGILKIGGGSAVLLDSCGAERSVYDTCGFFFLISPTRQRLGSSLPPPGSVNHGAPPFECGSFSPLFHRLDQELILSPFPSTSFFPRSLPPPTKKKKNINRNKSPPP